MNTKSITMLIVVVFISLASANAEVFDIPATGAWMRVQDGETTQWSAISSAAPKTRIDLVSYAENGNRITYYLIRSACPNGKIASAIIKAGNKLGVGIDCNGNTVTKSAVVLDKVQKLPVEAVALLKH